MSDLSAVKIECPACGQHYSLELGDEETEITCAKCNALFTASRIDAPTMTESLDDPELATRPDSQTQPDASGSSHSNPTPRPPFLDGFIALMFRFGKTFAGGLAVIFLLGILVSAIVFLVNLRSSIDIPTYEDLVTESGDNAGSGSEGTAGQLDERRDVEKRFGDDLAALVKKHSLGNPTYDDLLVVVRQVEKEYRGDYVSGLEDVLSDAAKSKEKNAGKAPTAIEVARNYSTAFVQAEQKAMNSKTEAKISRWSALGSMLLCCFMLFMMLVIPALLKIEENTRRRDS